MNHELPGGKYYIGDPCYIIDNSRWDEFIEQFWGEDPRNPRGKFDFDGLWCCVFNTLHGDGIYNLEPEGLMLPVDSGTIGAIPVGLITSGRVLEHTLVKFDEPFMCQEVSGTLYFGGHKVNTRWIAEDDECERDYTCT